MPWVPAAVAIIATGMSLWHWRRYAIGEASRRWPRVEGKILDFRFEVDQEPDGDAQIVFGDGALGSYSAHLVYEYIVDGRRYRSRHFTYRPTRSADPHKVGALLRGVRKGQAIHVRYDPNRPQRAVVLPGTDDANLWRIAVWALIALISAAYAFAFPASV
jgi:hypothetical protein